jgi:uncharacterized protein YggT (Ycf19 family)
MDSYHSPTTKPLWKGTQIVWYLLSLIEAVLIFRFILKLTGANPTAGFTNLIYTITGVLTAPFRAVFPRTVVEGSIFEWSTLLAMLVYWVLAMGIVKLFLISKTVSTGESAAKLDQEK